MLGSFPPPKARWSMNFYYPNIQNDMWRILGLIFYNDPGYFLIPGKKAFDEEKAKTFCREKGIAIGDTAESIIRQKGNASDKFLEVVKPICPEEILHENKENSIRIPMNPSIRSLNLSNSVAIVLYEALRQQNFANMQMTGTLTKYDWD